MAGASNPETARGRRGHGAIVTPPGNRKSPNGNPAPTATRPSAASIPTKLQRIADLARQSPGMSFTSLAYYMDVDWLREAYRRTRKDGAVGVDGQTSRAYAENLEANLPSLIDRAKSGAYWAPPVRRAHVPKGGGGAETRPIGIPTFEDKVLQRAVLMLLEPIYEQDFLGCSYGFRPGRSPHGALRALREQIVSLGGCWLVEIDFRKYFDRIDHGHLRKMLRQRVRDGVLCRLIGKWLKAGVMEEERVFYPGMGTPQGGVISPLLSNVYLHEVLDRWFEQEVRPRMRGRCFLVRFADDAVLGFTSESDAQRFLAVLRRRCDRYGLSLHPNKTRTVDFRRPPRGSGQETFDFLGFTHYWGQSRRGYPVVKRRTARDRFTRAVRKLYQWCRAHRHDKVRRQYHVLRAKLRGHYQYYGIRGNWAALDRFRQAAKLAWRKWLGRRSQRRMSWAAFDRLHRRYRLPPAYITSHDV
jgi:RNA-directed DNA polymerase